MVPRLTLDEKRSLFEDRSDLKPKKRKKKKSSTCPSSPLHAALKEHKDVLGLLQSGVKVKEKNALGQSVFHVAAKLNALDDIEMLFMYDFEDWHVNQQDSSGETALHVATYHGHYEMVMLLLDVKYNPLVCSYGGETAMDIATSRRHWKIAQLLSKRTEKKKSDCMEMDLILCDVQYVMQNID